MLTRLDKVKADLNKARTECDEWEQRVKDLEGKHKETENTMIHDMAHAANTTPEQLAELIQKANVTVPFRTTEDIESDG